MARFEFSSKSALRGACNSAAAMVVSCVTASVALAQEATPAADTAVKQGASWSWWLIALFAIIAFVWYWLVGRKVDSEGGAYAKRRRDELESGLAKSTSVVDAAPDASTAQDAKAAVAEAAAAAPVIRSSLMSNEETQVARKKAEDARIAAEKAALERLSTARRAAEEAARARSSATSSNPEDSEPVVKAKAKKKAAAPAKLAKVEPASAKPERKAPPKKAAAKPKKAIVDDITLVDGIGPKLKKELAEAGIRSLSDLSKLSAQAIAALDSKIPRDADQIADWVAQAKDLLAGKAPRAASDRERKNAK